MPNWSNKDNAGFYESVPVDLRETHYIEGGVSDCSDLKVIHDYILGADSILEIGAGFGRVVKYLIENNPNSHIAAIERNPKDCKVMESRFGDKATIFNADLWVFKPKQKYDLILWMISGISDFAKHEQPIILKRLKKCLAQGGYLILDTFDYTQRPINVSDNIAQDYAFTFNDHRLNGYIPSPAEIKEYSKQAGYKLIKQLPYETSAKRKRFFHVLSL